MTDNGGNATELQNEFLCDSGTSPEQESRTHGVHGDSGLRVTPWTQMLKDQTSKLHACEIDAKDASKANKN